MSGHDRTGLVIGKPEGFAGSSVLTLGNAQAASLDIQAPTRVFISKRGEMTINGSRVATFEDVTAYRDVYFHDSLFGACLGVAVSLVLIHGAKRVIDKIRIARYAARQAALGLAFGPFRSQAIDDFAAGARRASVDLKR